MLFRFPAVLSDTITDATWFGELSAVPFRENRGRSSDSRLSGDLLSFLEYQTTITDISLQTVGGTFLAVQNR